MVKCKDCKYWRNYQDRIYANISGGLAGSLTRGTFELRPCEFRPSPNVTDVACRYTDKDYTCNDGVREE